MKKTKILSVATAGVHSEQLKDDNHLNFPRVDYIELQRLLDVETIDYSAYNKNYSGKIFRSLETQLRSDVYMATMSWWKSQEHPQIFAWSERAGIPIATYMKFVKSNSRFVSMFQCWSERQEQAITRLNLLSTMDQIVVHCPSMKENLVRLGAPEDRVRVIHYSVDQAFYSPLEDVGQSDGLIVSVGETRSRLYPSLFKAVDDLPITLMVAGYGHWYAREKIGSVNGPLPANVTVTKHLSYTELRTLYARSQFVVLPIQDLVYSAGATTTLEAGSMARAVIAYRSRGITDYIIDGETGILVEPGNTAAMRDAIQYLLSNPREAKRLGQNARQRILQELTLETYVGGIAAVLMGEEQVGKVSNARISLPVA